MADTSQAFEVWQDPDTGARFCFSHSDTHYTTGVLVLMANTELPKHNRPLAIEHLLQVHGVSQVTLFDEGGVMESTYELRAGSCLRMKKGQWHVHANPFEDESVTLFKAEGDIMAVVQQLRETYTNLRPVDIAVEHEQTIFPS